MNGRARPNAGRSHTVVRWALCAWLWAVFGLGSAQAAYVQRYSNTTNGAVTFAGNTLGLNKANNLNSPGTVGASGAFITTNNSLTVGGYPAGSPSGGTTLNWTLNGSTAPLVIPAGSTVLYAELIWSGSYAYGGQTVAANLGSSVTLTTPAGTSSVAPAAATAQTLGAASGGTCTTGPCYYVRSQDVTVLVRAGGAGLYSIGGVPATISATDNSANSAGWTLAVVYGNAGLPARNLTVFVGAEVAGNAPATVTGFCTAPTGSRSGRLLVSALEGDAGILGDQIKFGPALATMVALQGPNNPVGNFFASQINKDDGTLDTGGSYGTYNQTPGSVMVGRQGYDITNVDISSTLVASQTSALAQGTTTGDNYMINALGVQINVASPSFPTVTKTASKAIAKVGDTITYTVLMNNTGTNDASSVVFTDALPPGTSFVANSLTLDGVTQSGANPATGVTVGTIAAGATKTAKFDVLVTSIPASPAIAQYSNTASWTYTYVSCTGQPAVNGALTTAPAITSVARLSPTKTVSPSGTVVPGQTLTYTISIPNTGTANSAGSSLADAIPAGTTYVAGSTTLNGTAVPDVAGAMPFAAAAAINSPTRPAGQVNVGESATVSFRVTVNAGVTANITNTATVDVDGAGGAPATTAQVVSPVALLTPTKAVSPVGAVSPGQVMTYTITVPNSGSGNTAGSTLADAIPAGTTYVAGSTTMNGVAVPDVAGAMPFATAAAIKSPSGGAGQINAAETATIVFRVTLNNAPGPGPIVNTAIVDADGVGPAAAQSAQAASPVLLPNMLLTKGHAGQFAVGNVGLYTLQASNVAGAGQVNAGPITVVDSLPTGLTVAALPSGANWDCSATVVGSSSASCTYTGAYPVTGGTALAPISLQVNVAAAAVPSVTNSATLTPVPGETATANNTASDPTVVWPKPTVSKAFSSSSIPTSSMGGVSTLTLTISNPAPGALTGLALSDGFPTGLVVATAPALANTCGGTVGGATAGSAALTLSGGGVAAGATCSISVAVTSAAGGSYANTSSGVASIETGSAGAASNTAVLVVIPPPQLSKTFAAPLIGVGERTTLSLTLVNPWTSAVNGVAFTDPFPAGLVIASPANVSNTCGGSVTGGTLGGNTIGLGGGSIAAGASCQIRVDVTSATVGTYLNTTTSVGTSNAFTGSAASAALKVLAKPTVTKSFSPAQIASGGTSTLTLTIAHTNADALTAVSVADSFPSGLSVAAAPALSNSCGGTVAGATAGSGALSLSGGALAAAGSCSISVAVTATTLGSYLNTAGAASSAETLAGAASNSATLVVLSPPSITKSFSANPIGTLSSTTLTLTVSNTNAVALSGVSFNDGYPSGLTNASSPNVTNTCGGTVTGGGAGGNSIGLTGGGVAANSSCTVTVRVGASANGSYVNLTGAVSSSNAGTGNTATATLVVAANPTISKSFSPTLIPIGGVSTLTLTLSNSSPVALTGVAVADNFPSGLVVAGTPALSNTCGGSITGGGAGSNALALSGGAIAATSSCNVTIQVTAAASGDYANTTGAISSTETGPAGASNTAVLRVVSAPTLVKAFSPSTISVGGNTVMSFVLTDPNAGPLTGLAFTDTFPAALKVSAVPTASNSCGGTLTGATAGSGAFSLSGGTLPGSGTCTIRMQVTSAVAGSLTNTSGGVSSNEAPTGPGSNASVLVVVVADLRLSKTHTGSFVVGSTGSYTLTVDNVLGTGPSAGTVTVTDNLPTGLSYVPAGSGGTGWSCSAAGSVVTCTSSTVIPAGGTAAPITLNVAVASVAVPSVTNLASVSGGGEPSFNSSNNSAADFTVVDLAPQNTFSPDGQLSGAPGTVVSYPHVFNAALAGTVSFSTLSAPSPAIAGWNSVVYRDDDCNGVLNGAEASAAPLTASVAVTPGSQVCIVVREFIPATATLNATDTVTVRALFTPSGPGSTQTLTRTDITTATGSGAGLVLAKSVRNVTLGGTAGTSNVAASGHTLEYTITYTNNGSAPLGNIVISDATPGFSNFVLAACSAPLPASISSCTVTSQPSVGGSGGMSWTLGGVLAPGASGSVTFRVTVQ